METGGVVRAASCYGIKKKKKKWNFKRLAQNREIWSWGNFGDLDLEEISIWAQLYLHFLYQILNQIQKSN